MKVYVILYTNENYSATECYKKGYTDLVECQTRASELEDELWEVDRTDESVDGDEIMDEDDLANPWSTWIEEIEVEEKAREVKKYDSRSTWKLVYEFKDSADLFTLFDDWRNENGEISAKQLKELADGDWYGYIWTGDLDTVNWQQVADDLNEMD